MLVLSPDYPPAPGGIQLLIHRIAQNLGSCTVVTLGVPGSGAFDAGEEADVRRVGSKGGRFHKGSIAALNLAGAATALRTRPDAVISGHVTMAPAALTIQKALGRPMLQYLHADEVRTRPRLVAAAVRGAAAVVAVSSHSQAMALSFGADPASVHVVHPGVDPVDREPSPREGRPTVVTVARMFESYKGHDVMIEALPSIRARIPDVQWVVIGDGPLRPSLERLAADRGVADSVRFLGSVDDRAREDWLSRSHAFAMPSRLPPGGVGGEGFGIVYLEAAAHGLPVVAGRAEALGAAGADRARRFTWEAHTDAVREILEAAR
jgi:phosphatidylinositol alpha-1,6-mannosyltransferase